MGGWHDDDERKNDEVIMNNGADVLPVLHKDFYQNNQAPILQCEKYCWGNLEAAHPVLSRRSQGEVDEYRKAHGIDVEVVRGRPPPKPFQSFSETSFPVFVEELAKELFTQGAVPFPVQAQVWPCVLSGSDVVAVAPTGSGKTLAFLLPALVHIIAQPELDHFEGPIALVLEPTRELVQQTLKVAYTFTERMSDEDRLRVGAVFGGKDPKIQVPTKGEPDFERWPELLIATPGRLVELISRKRWIKPDRISYVVLDEADALLSPRTWLGQIKTILRTIRPDRQLLMLSATWPEEAETAAKQLCGEELVRVRVDPAIPPIRQEVRLFPGPEDFDQRRDELIRMFCNTDIAADEAVLLLCKSRENAALLADDALLAEAACTKHCDNYTVLAHFDGTTEERNSAYWRFVRGDARVLVATFGIGARGLDYADTVGTGEHAPLSVVVVLFDFPPTIRDYAHCIGRTHRPGQRSGRVIAFLPEMRFCIGRELAHLLRHCEQPVPQQLVDLIQEDKDFMEVCKEAMVVMQEGKDPCQGEIASFGDYDSDRGVWRLPATLPSYRRKLLHWLADEIGLPHASVGQLEGDRRLHIARHRDELPDKFFVEGETVDISENFCCKRRIPSRGVVADQKIHRRTRTIRVRFAERDEEVNVPVDFVTAVITDA